MDIDNDGLLGTMKLLCWNCHGLGHPYSIRALRRLVKEERPDLVFLSETKKKVCELQSLRSMFGLSSMIKMDCEGEGRQRMSGLLLMCNDNIEVDVKSLSQNHINFMVKVWNLTRYSNSLIYMGIQKNTLRDITWSCLILSKGKTTHLGFVVGTLMWS